MANKKKAMDSIRDFLIKLKALDEELPEELAEDALQMTEEVKDALEEEGEEGEAPDIDVKDETEEGDIPEIDIEKKVEDSIVRVLKKYGMVKDACMASLDELEEELEAEAKAEDEEVEIESEDDNTVDPKVINSQDDAKALLKKVKPIIANVKDSRDRRILANSFAKALKLSKGTADYASILKASRNSAKDHKSTINTEDLGSQWAAKYNPHYNKEEN